MSDPDEVDLLVVGAGPAGMAAAIEGARLGLSVTLVDEQHSPGGQIYRNLEMLAPHDREFFGAEFVRGADLIQDVRKAPVRRLLGATLWYVGPDLEAAVNHADGAVLLRPKYLLIATGAMERPFPIPGWTLPGVMTAGSAQIALKSADSIPDGRIVLAGGGPLLYLVATQLLRAGADVAAVLDTTPVGNYFQALSKLARALRAPGYLVKGLGLIASLRRRVKFVRNVRDLAAEKNRRGLTVSYRIGRDGDPRSIEADWLLLHQGIVPNVQVARSLDCLMRWDEGQLCFKPVADHWGETTNPRVFCAGDGLAIGGARVAAYSGRLAALRIAERLGGLTNGELIRRSKSLSRMRRRHLGVRSFLDALYRPLRQYRVPSSPDVLVCRCEEVSAGEIVRAVDLGAIGPNQAKFFSRCGMGPCQGRMCGLTVAEIMADKLGVPLDDIGYFRVRPPIKPVRLAEVASMYPEFEQDEVHFS